MMKRMQTGNWECYNKSIGLLGAALKCYNNLNGQLGAAPKY